MIQQKIPYIYDYYSVINNFYIIIGYKIIKIFFINN